MISSALSRLLFVAWALVAAACARPLTELVVVVDTDLAVGQTIDTVDIAVTGPSMGQPVHGRASLTGIGAVTLPVTFTLVPAATDRLTPVTIVVTALQGGNPVVTRTVRTGFVLNQRRLVPVVLARSCIGVACGAGETCSGTRCETTVVDPAVLPPFTGPITVLDGGRRDACVPHTEQCNGADDDCDGVADNGIDVGTDTNNCGACGHVCMLAHANTVACVAGQCVPTICSQGYDNCDGITTNGCEMSVDTLSDCGACHTTCSRRNASATCAGGTCRIDACQGGFGDCDGTDTNGCEATLDQLDHCGSCPMTCARANATPTCSGGTCAISLCAGGFGNCDMTDANGCETTLNTPLHCGTCGTVCSFAHAASICAAGTGCAIGACDTSYADCDANAMTGCESDVRTSVTNCGRCGHACAATFACNNAVCDNERIAEVVAGAAHTCVRRLAGGVLCWGANNNGQLGDGSTTQRVAPTVVGAMTNADAIAAGDSHTCVHRGGATGPVQCWGQNTYGQLGNGSTTQSAVPVAVTGLTGALHVAAGVGHSCATLSSGAVRCWGLNSSGQLGDGTLTQRLVPVSVTGITLATNVASGAAHTCALVGAGSISCWGANPAGQLGDGGSADHSTPVSVMGIFNATAIAAGGNHTCALLPDASVRCWGDNAYGQLGDGAMVNSSVPVTVAGLSDAVSIAAGVSHTCAQRRTGGVVCWGFNFSGQIGDGTNASRLAPTAASGVSGIAAIGTGGTHTCAINGSSVVQCWGGGGNGQLGNGATSVSQLLPVTVLNLA
ncbi:MAG: hypothetical protein WCJ30_12450 [Deltaproteobacteria bacterium]